MRLHAILAHEKGKKVARTCLIILNIAALSLQLISVATKRKENK